MKLSTRYGVVGIAALAALTAVQWLRENGYSNGEIPAYLLGVLPNLFAAIAITFVVQSFFADQRKLTDARNATPWFLLSATIAGAGLTGWEYLQRTSGRFVFDLHDIAATIVGLAVSVVFIFLSRPVQKTCRRHDTPTSSVQHVDAQQHHSSSLLRRSAKC